MYKIIVNIEEKDVDKEVTDKQAIVDQSVKKGEVLGEGDEITLYIPKAQEKYPDFVSEGWSEDKIREWATEHEVNLTIEYQETEDYDPGTVISQSRAKDVSVVSGATLKIIIAKERTDSNNG